MYAVDSGAMLDAGQACETLDGNEFIFDVQTHHVNPKGGWRAMDPGGWVATLNAFPYASCGETDRVECFGVSRYIHQVFANSDTHVACLTGVPAEMNGDPLLNDERIATREIVDRLAASSQRLLVHVSVLPQKGAPALDAMQAWVEAKKPVSAWKVYPSFGDWKLDEAIGIAFIERARALGVKLVCAHRGISGDAGGYMDFSSPRDLVAAAKMFPDVTFVAYHSGWEPTATEGAYDAMNPRGSDRLIKAMQDYGNPPNVYAELGSTWRYLMTRPLQAQHLMGKLLQYLGEDKILYGSDCIWTGSPQEQIVAMRALTIPAVLGYPELTAGAKKKILGLNAAKVYGVDPKAMRCKIRPEEIDKALQK